MYSITGKQIKLLPYQKRIIDKLKIGNDYILSGPTSSGKTILAYFYAGILDKDEFNESFHKVIICSPIKALSNERYIELKDAGFDVGIETGDNKVNVNARILCVTQEIYLLKYCSIKKCRVIIDEVHYMFSEKERAKSYMDSILKTSKASNLLLLSATISNAEDFKNHLNKLTNRNFNLITWNDRPVPLEYDIDGINLNKIRHSIIFAFSVKQINFICEQLYKLRDCHAVNRITLNEITKKWNCDINPLWHKGISPYHSKLLPKVKHCIEELYRSDIIDIIVGTDALALGVNLPAKTVVFSTLKKQNNNHELNIKPSLFFQLAGRAGRYGYHNKGIVTYIKNGSVDKKHFSIYIDKKLEKMYIETQCDIAEILKGKDYIKELKEVELYYYPDNSAKREEYLKKESENILKKLDYLHKAIEYKSDIYKELIYKYYISEFSIDENLLIM